MIAIDARVQYGVAFRVAKDDRHTLLEHLLNRDERTAIDRGRDPVAAQ